MSASPQLLAENLSRSFGDREVVRKVGLTLSPGEVVGLLGPNGAGKTTIFRMLSGALRPSQGTVTLGGKEITSWPLFRRARLGLIYLPQEVSVFRRLSVSQNIELVLETVEPDKAARKVRLASLLSELGLEDRAAQRAGALSGGERRRLEITRALVLEPSFMLLDEPLAGVDPLAVEDIQKIIGELKTRGIGIMITDHNVRETLSVCDRAYILHDGCILKAGSPEEIVEDARVRETYLGENFSLI